MTKWLFYRVPDHRRLHYVLCIFMISVIIPEFVMGITFTNLGHFLNFLFFDILYYVFLKIETADDN
jgi:hypothetical protein